jgi:N-acetylglucosaminyl-diphospho-decaprenol L-rhamnosyltransferase
VSDGPKVSFCVVNTNGRELLLSCLASIYDNPPQRPFEVLVLDNASEDGSADAVEGDYGDRVQVIRLQRRRGKAENDSELMERARGEFCFLLNEDSEVTAGAADELADALESRPDAAAAGARLIDEEGRAQPSAWRFPGVSSAIAGVLFQHGSHTVQSTGVKIREVDWVQSAGMMVRKAAFDDVGPLDPAFFVYSDEVDWQKRAHDAGWTVLYVPLAAVVHHEQLSHGTAARARIVEFSRNRDRFVRKHSGKAAAIVVRVLTSLTYYLRALAALALPRHSVRRYGTHAYHSLLPGRGRGLREAADAYNASLDEHEKGAR